MYIKTPKVLKLYNTTFYVPLIITQQPLDGFVSETGTFDFGVKVNGSRPIIYNWYKDGVIIPNSNTNILTISNSTSSDTANYYCIVNNNRYSVQTKTVKLGVISYLNIINQPTEIFTKSNTTVNFNISVVDPTTNVNENSLTYSWYKNDKLVYKSDTNKFYLFNVQYSDEGQYYAVANNLLNSVTSNKVNLTVYRPIEITRFPSDITLTVGKTVNTYLSCTGTMPVTAQWRKDGINFGNQRIINNGKTILVVPNAQTSNTGYYDCVLTNIVGSVTSKNLLVFVF